MDGPAVPRGAGGVRRVRPRRRRPGARRRRSRTARSPRSSRSAAGLLVRVAIPLVQGDDLGFGVRAVVTNAMFATVFGLLGGALEHARTHAPEPHTSSSAHSVRPPETSVMPVAEASPSTVRFRSRGARCPASERPSLTSIRVCSPRRRSRQRATSVPGTVLDRLGHELADDVLDRVDVRRRAARESMQRGRGPPRGRAAPLATSRGRERRSGSMGADCPTPAARPLIPALRAAFVGSSRSSATPATRGRGGRCPSPRARRACGPSASAVGTRAAGCAGTRTRGSAVAARRRRSTGVGAEHLGDQRPRIGARGEIGLAVQRQRRDAVGLLDGATETRARTSL